MAIYYGQFEDANGNIYMPEVEASDVIMSDNSTAQAAIASLLSQEAAITASLAAMNANFDTILNTNNS